MRAPASLQRLAREESGITLTELLVVMLVAIITSLALFAFQDLALRQTSRVFARVDATQGARNAIEILESRLHSSCVTEGATPILEGSDANVLEFISEYGAQATLTPDKHMISLTSAGKLTDTVYPALSGASAPWTDAKFSTTSTSTTTILDSVGRIDGSGPGTSGSAALFTYYPYDVARDASNNAYQDAAGNDFVMLLDGASTLPPGTTTSTGGAVGSNVIPANSPSALAVPLTSVTAQSAAAVKIDLKVYPDGKLNNTADHDITPIVVSNSVVLRITPVPSDNNQGVPPVCE